MRYLIIILSFLFIVTSCGTYNIKTESTSPKTKLIASKSVEQKFKTGADDWRTYLPVLKKYKNIGVIANQSSLVNFNPSINSDLEYYNKSANQTMHLVDWLLENKLPVQKIFAPEHGFRGTADAGELINDGKDIKTGLPIISLYGNNKKPKEEQLENIDVLVFDLQDVGARFYTYISSLHYIMEACAEKNIPLYVMDRPNPNGTIVDGPILEKEYTSFVGMHPIPILHGMTIGEYAKMINGEKWLKDEMTCDLKIIPCLNYSRTMSYDLPEKPSPNLPNAQAINLYASLCLFEGTNVSVGRGTEKQFQIYGSPYLLESNFNFTPKPNEGAKDPLHNGTLCYGKDLSKIKKVTQLEIKWLLEAYNSTPNKEAFFNSFFVKLAGTKQLQNQIEQGISEKDIRKSWEDGLNQFMEIRKKYLIYD